MVDQQGALLDPHTWLFTMFKNLVLQGPLVILDLETTGVDPSRNRIVEICVLKVLPDGQRKQHTRRLNPGIPIPADATAVHGISDADVSDMPGFNAIAERLLDFLTGCEFSRQIFVASQHGVQHIDGRQHIALGTVTTGEAKGQLLLDAGRFDGRSRQAIGVRNVVTSVSVTCSLLFSDAGPFRSSQVDNLRSLDIFWRLQAHVKQ
jgi:hypothetical protein